MRKALELGQSLPKTYVGKSDETQEYDSLPKAYVGASRDFTLVYEANVSQEWLRNNVPGFILAEDCTFSIPDLSTLIKNCVKMMSRTPR